MSRKNPLNYSVAIQDFKRARKQAAVQQLMARLTGKSTELLAYNYVHPHLGEANTIERGLQEIPLDAIVGSMSRYDDFTRDFLPKKDSDQERWARVKTAVLNMRGMEPIDVYQIGEVYFVSDGHHRVSVAKQLGTRTISARVIEIKTRAPLAIDDDLDEVICKARHVEFLEKTKLDKLRPETNILLTLCDHYHVLLAQIEAHQRQLATEYQRDVSDQEAVTQWHDHVYQPIANIIREQGVLQSFPERTETDLYLLCVEHRDELVHLLGWHVDIDAAIANLAKKKKRRLYNTLSWLGFQMDMEGITNKLGAGPKPGEWRKGRLARRKHDSMFADILVGVQQKKAKWRALDQAVMVAKREKGRLFGLHVVSDKDADNSKVIGAVHADFKESCRAAKLDGELTVEVGEIAQTILKRALWADLVVVRLARPPQAQPLRLSPGFNALLQQCPRPILVVPSGAHSLMDRALLAYDGSPKADEALFIAAYLASRWQISLTVVSAGKDSIPQTALEQAKTYLTSHGVDNAAYVSHQKPVVESIVATAEAHNSNMLIMGGFSFRPVLSLVLGSTVDQIIREFRHPILICR